MKRLLLLLPVLLSPVAFCMNPHHKDGKECLKVILTATWGRGTVELSYDSVNIDPLIVEELPDFWKIYSYANRAIDSMVQELKKVGIVPLQVYTTWQPWYYDYIRIAKTDVERIDIITEINI